MKKIVCFILLSLVWAGCNEAYVPRAVTPALMGKGNLHGNGSEDISQGNRVVDNQYAWNQLMEKMNTLNNVTGYYFTDTSVDFSNYVVLALFDEVKAKGGHSIDISEIIEYENHITVYYYHALKGNLTSIITQPFHVVKIPKQDKPIYFQYRN